MDMHPAREAGEHLDGSLVMLTHLLVGAVWFIAGILAGLFVF
jgi:hypothetical protein